MAQHLRSAWSLFFERLRKTAWIPIVLGLSLSLGVAIYHYQRDGRRIVVTRGIVKNPPWLLWGNSITQDLSTPGGSTPATQATTQLIRIAYNRPENWRFLFSAQVLFVQNSPDATTQIHVFFDLTTGIGRSQVTIRSFERYVFVGGGIGDQRYSTEILAPIRDQAIPVTPEQQALNVVQQIPAQDIQLQARIQLASLTPQQATVRVDAYFTPNVHVRPEWFKGKFLYEEDEGH